MIAADPTTNLKKTGQRRTKKGRFESAATDLNTSVLSPHVNRNDIIKLKKDKQSQHHIIPLNCVRHVDDKVHVNRPSDQAMLESATSAPGFM